jgi:hypothetical protein
MQAVSDPADWRAEDLAASDKWIYRLTDNDIAELDAAVAGIEKARAEMAEIDIATIEEADFPLPGLHDRLKDISDQVLNGRGVALIKGVPVERYSRREAAIAYWGIGLRLGVPVSQNGKGHVLGHVKNLTGGDFNDTTHRGYHTSADLPWHADSCDVVALLCLQTSRSGGESYFVSSIAIHNEMIARRPDLAAEMAKPVLMEPIMKVEVVTPEDYMGDVMGDISSRRGRIGQMEARGNTQVVNATVPLSEMFGYSTDLRSRTQGRATYTMQFEEYQQVPAVIADDIIKRVRGE